MIRNLSETDFDQNVIECDNLTLVDFWADWCGPCKAFAPILDDVAEDLAGQVNFAKVDIVANEALAQRFNVRGIPLLVLFKGGEELDRVNGALSRTRLTAMLDKYL